MAKFMYTQKEWDKVRPKLMASTGLGAALKKYEVAKKQVVNSKSPWAEVYCDAIKAFAEVEVARLKAIKDCESKKHKEAAEVLKAADAKGEKSLLAARTGNLLVNVLESFAKTIKEVNESYDSRISIAKEALKAYKAEKVSGELAKSAEAIALNDGQDPFPSFPGKDEVQAAMNPKNGLKNDDGLKVIVAKCQRWGEDLKSIMEKRKEYEELQRLLKPLVQGVHKKMLEKVDKNAIF